MDQSTPLTEKVVREDNGLSPRSPAARDPLQDIETAYELGVWLSALRSFSHARNHPFSETERAEVLTRDWTNEVRITRTVLERIAQLTLRLVNVEGTLSAPLESAGEMVVAAAAALNHLSPVGQESEAYEGSGIRSLIALAEALGDVGAVCEALLEARHVSFHTWTSVGKLLARELDHSGGARSLARAAHHRAAASLQSPLLVLSRNTITPGTLGADMLIIFSDLARLLERLRLIEASLTKDRPLKPVLPLFTLVHEEARQLIKFIETRAVRTEEIDEAVFDALDSASYAISMELRKVFAHELVGLSALRQAPPIYARVENAHGLLRDSFQQSTVALAQLFDKSLDGTRLFNAFQTKLEQSLALRRDVWMLLQLVRRAEKEREHYPIARLLERLATFREGSLRYLMYKDWEACERFIEEVEAARGAVELAPVLHRFGTYLETLHGQVNMRAVLADHPFDFPTLES
ncbi:MAG TPA: hypothetical protein VF708_11595 [Pyrinomonadaceae bacterium]